MSNLPQVERTPEEEELDKKRAELAQSETELCDRELELETLRAQIYSLERDYIAIVGSRYAQLDQLNAEIASATATADPSDKVAQERAKEYRQKAHESAWAGVDTGPNEDSPDAASTRHEFQPSAELKKLFKKCVRMFHPDLVTDESEKTRREAFLKRLNEAYSVGDEDAIRRLVDEWHSSPENVEGDGAGAELVRVIRKLAQIRKRLKDIEAVFVELEGSELYELNSQIENTKADGRDLLDELAQQLDEQIAEARQVLASVS